MPLTIIDLGQKVKAKYPGTYDHLDDAELGRRVQAKYPQYSQFMDVPQGSTAPKVDMQTFDQAVPDAVKNAPLEGGPILPEGVVAAGPARILASLGGGSLGGKLAQKAAEYFGLSPENQQRAHFVGSVVGGALGGKAVPGDLGEIQAQSNPIAAPSRPVVQTAAAALKGSAKGAAQGASETLKIGPSGVKISPLEALRQAYKGGKSAVSDLNTQRLIQQARENPRIPAWMTQQPEAPAETQPVPAAPVEAPQLPSGRKVGPAPQAPPQPPPAPRTPLWQQLQAKMGFPVPSEPAPTPTINEVLNLPSGRQVGGIQNQPAEPANPGPKVSVINGKGYLHGPNGQFVKAAEMPAPQGSDRIVIVNGKPYVNISGHLFDPKALKK